MKKLSECKKIIRAYHDAKKTEKTAYMDMWRYKITQDEYWSVINQSKAATAKYLELLDSFEDTVNVFMAQ